MERRILTQEQKATIEKLRQSGMGYKTIATSIGLTRDQVRDYCRLEGLVGVRDTSYYRKDENQVQQEIDNKYPKFEYIGGYEACDKPMYLMCRDCGEVIIKNAQILREAYNKKLICPNCYQITIRNRHEGKERSRIGKLLIRTIKSYCKQKEQNRMLSLIHILMCSTCGDTFVSHNRNTKYCGNVCKNRNKNRRKEIRKRNYIKANGTIDYNISLEKLISRDHNTCHICKEQCDSSDFIMDGDIFITGSNYPSVDHVVPISKGGTHTWSNVKLAHHYCNTIKSNKVFYESQSGRLALSI